MTAGYTFSKTDIDNKIGRLVQALRDSFKDVVIFKAMLDDTTVLPDAVLQGPPLNYTPTETALIRAAFTDLKKLSDISNNAATQSVTNDFWFSAKHLTGIG
jgi:chemotaxis regulatin CheY-phosphate phosphatase CheZ